MPETKDKPTIPANPEMSEGAIPDDFNISSFAGVFNNGAADLPDYGGTEEESAKEEPVKEEVEETTEEETTAEEETTDSDKESSDEEASTDEEDSDEGDPDSDEQDSDEEESESKSSTAEELNDIEEALKDFNVPKGKSRDYSDFSEEEQKIVKGTSNKAFEYIKLQRQKIKELEESAPTVAADVNLTPTALAKADPEYNNTQQAIIIADEAIEHARAQILRIKRGEEYQPIIKTAEGALGAGEPVEPSPEGEMEMQQILQNLTAQRDTFTKSVAKMEADYESEVKGSVSAVTNLIETFEPAFKNKKSKIHAVVESVQSKLPKVVADSPLGKALAQSFALHIVNQKRFKLEKTRANGKSRDEQDDKIAGAKKKHSRNKPDNGGLMDLNTINAMLSDENQVRL